MMMINPAHSQKVENVNRRPQGCMLRESKVKKRIVCPSLVASEECLCKRVRREVHPNMKSHIAAQLHANGKSRKVFSTHALLGFTAKLYYSVLNTEKCN